MKLTQLNQITDDVYWLPPDERTDRPTLGVIVGSQATLIVDAGASSAHADLLLTAMKQRHLAKPSYVILTHWHWDHVFGAARLADAEVSALIFAHHETQRHVEEMVHLDWSDAALDQRVAQGTEIEFCRDMIKAELPDRTGLQLKAAHVSFSTELAFDLGDVHCTVAHVGGDHASDSCIVYVSDNDAAKGGVLFLSDCLYENLHQEPRHYTTQKLLPLLDKIERYDAETYVWGHHDKPMPKAEMVTFLKTLRDTGELVTQLGNDRASILEELPKKLSKPLDDDDVEVVDAFLAGLSK